MHYQVLQSTQSTSHHQSYQIKFTQTIVSIIVINIYHLKETLSFQIHISQQRRTTKHTMILIILNTQPTLIRSYSTLQA